METTDESAPCQHTHLFISGLTRDEQVGALYGAGIGIIDMARDEVVGVHRFFVAWFRSELPDDDRSFARFADATHRDFSMVTSATGDILGRNEVLGFVRRAHGSRSSGFEIDIRAFAARAAGPDAALVTYEEWQFDGDELLSARTSTAYFVADPSAPEGVAWRHLHETLHPAA